MQRVKQTWGPDGTANDVDIASGKPLPIQIRDSAGAAATVKAASTAPVASDTAIVVAMSPNGLNPNGQATRANSAAVVLASDQNWPTGMSPRAFAVAFATLTRPANTTAYAAGDSISNNVTAGSVTALVSGNIADTIDDPLTLTEIRVFSTDTGLAGKKIRAYVFRSDPTAASGVGAGDNAPYLQKVAGYVGSFQGWMETGFSDGTVGRLVPTFNETNNSGAGAFIVTPPAAGARTLWVQYQAVEIFNPSANSTTIIGTICGFQARAV